MMRSMGYNDDQKIKHALSQGNGSIDYAISILNGPQNIYPQPAGIYRPPQQQQQQYPYGAFNNYYYNQDAQYKEERCRKK